MDSSFEKKHHLMDYKFGEFHLFNVEFILWIYKNDSLFSQNKPNPYSIDQFSVLKNNEKSLDGYFFPSHPVQKKLPTFRFHEGKICYVPAQFNRFFINLDTTFNCYENKFSKKSKLVLKKKLLNFTALSNGKIDWKVYKTSGEFSEFCEFARQLSLKTYQTKVLDIGFPQTSSFEKHVLKLASEDKARGYLLFHKEEVVSYVFCECIDGVVIYKFVGYDPKYRKYSPGTILQYLLLQNLFEEKKFCIFDFTEGEGQHKEFFSTSSIQCADIYYFNIRFHTLIWISCHLLLLTASKLTVKLLKKFKIDQRVKKWIRSGGIK